MFVAVKVFGNNVPIAVTKVFEMCVQNQKSKKGYQRVLDDSTFLPTSERKPARGVKESNEVLNANFRVETKS